MKRKTTKYSYVDLVGRLTNLQRLAEPPLPGEKGGCMSSYDRRSRYDPKTDTYLDWDANDDGEGFIRREGNYVVAFEQEGGPGCIWRIWSALPQHGNIQIFIDDDERPVVDQPFRDFFDRFDQDYSPMNFTNLTPTLSRGRNRWIPIPYNKKCKVRLAEGWGRYFHFTYTKFPHGTELPRFDGGFNHEAREALALADRELFLRGRQLPWVEGDEIEQFNVTLEPGKTTQVHTFHGNRAITGMKIGSLNTSKEDPTFLLRAIAIQITWDDESDPAVWCPLGDFFGSVPGQQLYRTLPQGVTDGGFYSHWFMPFSRAKIAFSSDSSTAQKLTLTVTHRKLEQSVDNLLRFHAKWHRDVHLEKARSEGREIDWPLLMADNDPGPGRFVGVNMHIFNRWSGPTPGNWWWGEGDEKFFVDGEKFPSTFGTGSEDYVGYAWAADPPFPMFDSAFAAQPFVEMDSNGHTCINRFHIADDIPFQKRFEAYIEKYHGNTWGDNGSGTCLYAVVAYWYQKAGKSDQYNSVSLKERLLEQ